MDYLVVGCGFSGAVVARTLAEHGFSVCIWEKRNHIGGNAYDYRDNHGFIVQKYGPHIFHTYKKELIDFLNKFGEWKEQKLITCASWDGKYMTVPFDFSTIDKFYTEKEAEHLKDKLIKAFYPKTSASVLDLLYHADDDIRKYARFLFVNDYAPYTAKQWGIPVNEIDPSVLARVPVRFSYHPVCLEDTYQMVPAESFTAFFYNLLNHPKIHVRLGIDALNFLEVHSNVICIKGERQIPTIIYTGALDELFAWKYGKLPYRSLRFEWHYSQEKDGLPAPIVAYPQADGYTRITDYKSFLLQTGRGYSYAIEYPIPVDEQNNAEPYYPVLTAKSKKLYEKYMNQAKQIKNLIHCGRLGDFKYYNMDQAVERAISIAEKLIQQS